MTNSKILTTFFQMKSRANEQGNFFNPAALSGRQKAFDQKQKRFAALYERHHRPVYRLCLRMTQSVGIAEDLTQQVFFKLFKRLGNLHYASDVNREILRLAVDELLCYFLLEDECFNQTEKVSPPIIEDISERAAAFTIDRQQIEQAIAQLPTDFRLIFLLHDFEHLSHEEIAQILKIEVETSRRNLHEARNNLRCRLTN